MGIETKIKEETGEEIDQLPQIAQAPQNRQPMSKAEFKSVIRDCLRYAYEKLPAGNTPVIDINGNYAVQNVDNDLAIVLALVANVIIFNIKDFLTGGGLEELMLSVRDLTFLTPPTSTNTSSPQL